MINIFTQSRGLCCPLGISNQSANFFKVGFDFIFDANDIILWY